MFLVFLVFCTFLRQKSWDRAACGEGEHTRGKTMGGKKGEDSGEKWEDRGLEIVGGREKKVLQFSATEVLGS